MPQAIPQSTLRRLPRYCHYLADLRQAGTCTVSCSRIGDDLSLQQSQIQKDLQYAGVVGKPRAGYSVTGLIDAIETCLGWNNSKEAFLIGAGSLGTALLGYSRFANFGLDIVAAFDTDPAKIGQWTRGRLVLSMDKLPELAQRMRIHMGIITVPAPAAQEVANLLVDSGMLAIWNFAPVTLKVPARIIVHNEDLYGSLVALSVKLGRSLRAVARGGAK